MSDEKARSSVEAARDPALPVLPTVNPAVEKSQKPESASLHPSVYIATWIGLSSSVILYNKYILNPDGLNFSFPVFLTTWHLVFATIMTQILARFTTILDSRKKVPMTGRVYLRAIVPIGFFFSLSLIFNNQAYLYLSVSFIQMLKATTPVAVLITTWALGVAPLSMKTMGNVSFIVIGVVIASFGEIKFEMVGFLFQCSGIIFEAVRLSMVQRLLSGGEFKMDPLVSLYYYAPACGVMNAIVFLFIEAPRLTMADIDRIGGFNLIANATVAFLLNVSVVFLIGKTSSLVLTLSGVLKDILLVIASVFLIGDPITALQIFGYGIALGGLVYYKLGGEKLKEYIGQGGMKWAEFGQTRPAARKLLIIVAVLASMVILLAGLAPTLAPGSTGKLYSAIGNHLPESGV